jgi:hypothetical protein
MTKQINEKSVKQVCSLVDKGLYGGGVGEPVPGQMCVEAVVSYVFDNNNGDIDPDDIMLDDHPSCVDDDLADMKIEMNDGATWLDDMDRGKGLKRLAIAQIGSVGKFNHYKFVTSLDKQLVMFLLERAPKNPASRSEMEEYWSVQSGIYNIDDIDDLASEIDARRGNPGFDYSESDASWIACEMAVIALKEQKIKGTKFLYLAPRNKLLVKYFGKE